MSADTHQVKDFAIQTRVLASWCSDRRIDRTRIDRPFGLSSLQRHAVAALDAAFVRTFSLNLMRIGRPLCLPCLPYANAT